MDGTLIDSIGIWNEVDRRLISMLGEKDPDSVDVQKCRDGALAKYRTSENPYYEYCAELGKKYGSKLSCKELLKQRSAIAAELLEKEVDYKPGAPKVVKELKKRGYILGIVSTTRKSNIAVYRSLNKNIISKAPLDEYFSFIYTKEDAAEIKPSPMIYNRVFEEQGLAADECIVFEDSLVGVDAAKAAGIEVAVIYDKYSDGEREEINAKADAVFSDFNAVLRIIAR